MDAVAPNNERALDKWFASFLNDPRDVPFVKLILGCLGMAACGVGLYFTGDWVWLLAPAYLLVWAFVFLDRFILMLHCTSHRTLFRKEYKALNQVIPWVVGPFFGETPETYFVHHMGMHHPENNLEDDLSSTMRYQRDRVAHWLHYFFRFLFGSIIELGMYHMRKGNKRLARRMYIGEVGFWLAVIGLCFLNWQATLVVFVIPVFAVRALMMAGNWGQHAFVDGSDPGNAYKNSITCINTRYNRRCFNDGYHIHHHIKARAHWSEYPGEFETNKKTYGSEDAIVFEGIDFFQVWMYLMTKRYKTLAKHFVRLPGAPERNDDEVIAFLKSRLVPIHRAA
jgi:fatty acid desaturase